MRDFRRLKVWEKAHGLSLAVYKATATFPQQELFGLTSQLRRAAVSIPAKHCRGLWKEWRTRAGSIFKNCARICE